MAKKRVFIFLALTVALILTAVAWISIYRQNRTYSDEELLEMNKDALYELLVANGLEIPEPFASDKERTADFIESKLSFILKTPDGVYNNSSPETIAMTDSIRKTLKKLRKSQ